MRRSEITKEIEHVRTMIQHEFSGNKSRFLRPMWWWLTWSRGVPERAKGVHKNKYMLHMGHFRGTKVVSRLTLESQIVKLNSGLRAQIFLRPWSDSKSNLTTWSFPQGNTTCNTLSLYWFKWARTCGQPIRFITVKWSMADETSNSPIFLPPHIPIILCFWSNQILMSTEDIKGILK